MRALIVSDIHSNLEAFQSVIDDAEARYGFDEIWSLGDLIGYGPDPGPCVDLLRRYEHKGVAGNHDLAAIGKLGTEEFNPYAAAANRWTAGRLDREQTDYLGGLPMKLEIGEFTLVHGSPRDPVWEYVVSGPVAVANFRYFDTYRCLVGHSHIPFLCRPSKTEDEVFFLEFTVDLPARLGEHRLIINPGSVGQPRDGDPKASYAVYESEGETIVHHRVEYDIAGTQDKMRSHGLPRMLIDRLTIGH